jgi:hypothetical protein
MNCFAPGYRASWLGGGEPVDRPWINVAPLLRASLTEILKTVSGAKFLLFSSMSHLAELLSALAK